MPIVNICDYSTAVDAMVKKGSTFADRTIFYMFRLTRKNRGIIATNGTPWVEQRRFALHTLRNFGLGRNIIEERIMFEFEIACEELDKRLKTEGRSINAHENLELLIGNIINRMLFTERFEKKEAERFFFLKKRLDDTMENASLFDMLVEEWNVNWPLIRSRTDRLLEPFYTVMDFIRNQIEQRKREIANGTHVLQGEGDDFVDAFLVQMKKDKESDEMLVMSLLDLWIAGQETTITTLEWAFSFLLLHPHVKGKVEAELLSLTKGRRLLSIADRPNTPYYNATLTEIHRCASILPMNLWRNTSEDTAVGSYVIPKGTTITAQISVIMTDEKYFKNRNEFNPDRYLNGNKLDQKVVPFGLGKRSCLGESLAQAELYLEIHRCTLLVLMNLWRNTSEDTVVGSYVIPKGTTITDLSDHD
ncbi:unspecific monooxygenase [Cooperia oncophora]